MTEAETERAAVVAWLCDSAVNYERERWSGPRWRLWAWGVLHPAEFGRQYGWFKALMWAMRGIERGEHLTNEGK